MATIVHSDVSLKALTCPQCGGPNTNPELCDYCGTRFEQPPKPGPVVAYHIEESAPEPTRREALLREYAQRRAEIVERYTRDVHDLVDDYNERRLNLAHQHQRDLYDLDNELQEQLACI